MLMFKSTLSDVFIYQTNLSGVSKQKFPFAQVRKRCCFTYNSAALEIDDSSIHFELKQLEINFQSRVDIKRSFKIHLNHLQFRRQTKQETDSLVWFHSLVLKAPFQGKKKASSLRKISFIHRAEILYQISTIIRDKFIFKNGFADQHFK
jgi:hypothetical protein